MMTDKKVALFLTITCSEAFACFFTEETNYETILTVEE